MGAAKQLEKKHSEHMLSEVAHHVFNHGTYHRGHLRGLADAAGFEDFPETDLIRFYREKASP